MPKFNLNWMYMIIALMLLGLWWGSDSRGAGNKAVTYSEFQDYVKNGYVSKVLGYEDKSIEAYLKPNSVGAVFGADSTKVGRNPIITSRVRAILYCIGRKRGWLKVRSKLFLFPVR